MNSLLEYCIFMLKVVNFLRKNFIAYVWLDSKYGSTYAKVIALNFVLIVQKSKTLVKYFFCFSTFGKCLVYAGNIT